MSHYIDTPQASYGGSVGLSNRQRWEIVIGVIVAVVVGLAAFAFVSNTPVAEPVAQPATQSYAAADDLATRTVVPTVESYVTADDLAARSSAAVSGSVTQSALDPFELRSGSASGALGAGAIVEQSIADALELRSGSASGAAAGTTGGVVAQSALDPFETRSGSSQGQSGVEAETQYPRPEYR